ncbi:uncharacterized protein LOC116301045 isoform X2 [Actinia tenebrosa]|uniref:Uncharacterized protein LOC116301045 isoform X2 n=1 Tax=Actinia tenebrosa TaxID=6105 RepID=A0A6P8IGJ9_ACTTE|nr:uncharacterized protein LOC116301045 isoform X2 [Actinia tenebrosa]
MASNVNVIHRSNRGRTGLDVKAKTDSGCFVDDELEKQIQGEKSPPRKKDDLKIAKTNNQDTNILRFGSSKKSTQLENSSVPQNVVEGEEMSRGSESPKNKEIQDDLQGDIDFERSLENTEPREDFYCLYYSDSPNGSLTGSKDKSNYDQEGDNIGATAEELLKKIKEDALKGSPNAQDVEVQKFGFDQPPPIAPKPKRSSKQQNNSNISGIDPILAELEMLGSAVGRDFTSVETDDRDEGLLSNAVKGLHVAETPEECFDKFGDIQTALNENIPDTLERSKARSKKDAPRRKSLPEENKPENPSESRKGEEKGSSQNGKIAESPKLGKTKLQPKKFSRSEIQSLNSMREDSHHKRSHLNADNSKPVPTRSETYKLNRPDVSKQLSERGDSNKANVRKDPKLTSPKVGKPSPKKAGSKDVAKKRERLELRSGRRRRSGDLTSIPENAVMDDGKERRKSDAAIPLAKGEEDLSSEEEDLINDEDTPSERTIEEKLPPRSSYLTPTCNGETSVVSTSRTNFTCSTTTSSNTRTNIEGMTRSLPSQREEKTVPSNTSFTPRPFKQPGRFYNYRGRDHLSDGWTSESTAGYSSECSANDADDEGDKQVELELTENLQAYDDPNDIVDMTFGSQMDDHPEIEEPYVFGEEPFQQAERNDFVEATDAAPMYYYPEGSQEEIGDGEFAFPRVLSMQDTVGIPDLYEHYQSEDGAYPGTSHSDLVFPCADNNLRRQTVRKSTSEEHVQPSATKKPNKFQKEEGPDPSGFMTVEDIKRLIFQGAKPSIPRSTSCYGISSSRRRSQEQEVFQRRSWSGYGSQQQQEPGIDPLVRNFPQKSQSSQRLPKGQKSPYVRTIQPQRPTPQLGYYSDTQLNTVDQEEERFLEPSRSFHRTPLQRRAYSLETYHSDNSIPDEVSSPVVRQSDRSHLLVRSASDCSANYSQRQPYGQLQSPPSNRSPMPQYIDTKELANLVSSRSSYASGRGNVVTPPQRPYMNPHGAQYQIPQSQRGDTPSLPRYSSEELRIQALRRASQRSSDSDSEVSVHIGLPARSNVDPPSHQLKLGVVNSPTQKTLSERFSEVPQRVTFEELAEKLNLSSDSSEEDEIDYGSVNGKADSEFGADLEFDNGDYFDDKNMIVGEALRLKKVLGQSVPEQDPELETLVTATTDPKLPEPPQSVYEATSPKSSVRQPSDALVFESPPPYHEVRRKTSETSGSESCGITLVYDVPPLYESETESHPESTKMKEKLRVDLRDETKEHLQLLERRDSETQTNGGQQPTEKAISAEELLKLLLNASQGNLEKTNAPPSSQAKSQQLVQNLYFPKPQTKAASTGNIHSEEKFPGHVAQLYGNSDLNSARSSLRRRLPEPQRPTCHKSQECIRYKHRLNRPVGGVLQAKMIGSEANTKKQSKRIFEEEVDCMKTKGAFGFSSGEISTSGSSIDDVENKKDRLTSVSFVGCEDTKEIETLPKVKFSSQRKRTKARTGYLSDQDIPTAVQNGGDKEIRFKRSSEGLNGENIRHIEQAMVQKPSENKYRDSKYEKQSLRKEMPCSEDKDVQKIKDQNRPEIIDLRSYNDKENESQERSDNSDYAVHEFPHDNRPSPNSVNVFIDYNKKNVMKITTSTPKVHHAKLVTPTPQGISPVSNATNCKTSSPHENGCSYGEEEFPPRYETSPPIDRSSSVYSSDDEKFFGSSDTVVFVDKTAEKSSVKPNVDNTTVVVQDQGASSSNGDRSAQNDEAAKAQEYCERVDFLLQEVRSSLDLDSIGSDLLDQAMERVKDKLSPRSSQNQGRGSITMEAFVALHQADELQAIINEIKGELWILQQENTLLKEKVVSLQHGEACSSSESTEDSLTESAERIDSIRRQIAAVAASKKRASECEDTELISVDVFLKGFGCALAVRHSKKMNVKLGTVKVRGGTDWGGVYDAAKATFLDHVKRIDPCSCLGLGPTSMYGAQIGATMLTPETLRRKDPRVEISRKCNSCVIQLKDGMSETFDTLVYETLIPRHVVESFIHQILENRFIVLCGAAGLGKTFLATKLAEHLAQRFGSKNESPVLTLAVGQTSRKELKKTLADLMKCDISSPSHGVPVVVVLDQLDCLASLADIFDPKQLEGNRNSPFIIGVRNKSKKGPFSSKDLAVYKYFRWIQLAVHDPFVLGLLERFLRRKLSWADDVEDEEDLLDLFLWLTHVWQRINQILQSYVDIDVTIGPSVFYSCPMDMCAAEGWFANVWNYTIIPYLHQNLRNSSKIYERNEPWECPTKWVIMRWPWNRDKSKVLGSLKKLRQVDIVLNRNQQSPKGNTKGSQSKMRKLLSSKLAKNPSPSKAGSLESWSTADWDAVSMTSDVESIASSTL